MDAVSYAHSAKQAKRITGLMRIEETEPTEVELGTEWYVPSTGKTYKRINDGSNDVWIDVGSSGANAAIKQSEEFVVGTASGNYDGNSLNTFPTQYGYYTDYVLAVLNGKILAKDDFTATDGYNVVLAEDAVNGDIVEVIAFGTFVVADHYTKGEIDAINSAQDSVIAGKALLGGSATQRFKVADAVNNDDAVSKEQLLNRTFTAILKLLTVGDNTDNKKILSINGSGYTPYIGADTEALIIGHNSQIRSIDFETNDIKRFRIEPSGQMRSVLPNGTTLLPMFNARAWVNFDGTGTVAIRAGGNVSSITDNGDGDYTVNFIEAMPDASYACLTTSSTLDCATTAHSYTTTSVRVIQFLSDNNTYTDGNPFSVAIIR